MRQAVGNVSAAETHCPEASYPVMSDPWGRIPVMRATLVSINWGNVRRVAVVGIVVVAVVVCYFWGKACMMSKDDLQK